MATTTLKLPEELKARITSAAEAAGKTPHQNRRATPDEVDSESSAVPARQAQNEIPLPPS